MKKHAYLIVAHDKFDQLAFLLQLLDYPHHDFFVHIDKKSTISPEEIATLQASVTSSNLTLIPRRAVYWGDFSQIQCELDLFEAAHATADYEFYHLLSGVDLPLRSPETIYHFFSQNTDKNFITRFNQDEFQDLKLHKLVEHYHLTTKFPRKLPQPWHKFVRAYRILENKVQTALKIDRLKGNRENWGLDAYANWKSINKTALEAILADKTFIYHHFHHSFCADELYVPMVFTRAKLLPTIYHYEHVTDTPDEVQGNLSYINWWDGHPYEWTDSPEDMAQLEKGIALGHFFSRKFDLNKAPGLKDFILEKTRN
ncbi:TPA: beta-1,6-N-acetylglucosaminyltransferase [Streptococcus suis]